MIRHGDNGYVRETNNIFDFRRCVKQLIHDLPGIMESVGANTIVVRGKSGVAMVHALAIYLSFNLLVVRKPGENSHGQRLEGWGIEEAIDKYIILDDFICSGITCKEILDEIEHPRHSYDNTPAPKCAGILLYSGSSTMGCALDTKKTLGDYLKLVGTPLHVIVLTEEQKVIPVIAYL